MQKITQLYRLNWGNRLLVIRYLLKRVLHWKTTENERKLNEFYFHLISFKGFLKQENTKDFVSAYPDLGVTLKIRKRPSSDMDVFSQIYRYLEYKPVVEVFQKHFPNDKKLNFIDAGSNIGLTSVYFSTFFPGSNFIVIEPDDSNFETMSFNLLTNGIEAKEKVKGGIWSTNSFLRIVSDFRDKNDWSFRVEETTTATNLKAYSINYLVKENNFETIDILKIDIEGSEKEVFTSPKADVSYLAKTKCVAIEIHDEFDCREAIYKVLRQYNFEFFNSGELTIGINQNLL
ncbi:FkbM family methyltransferase [Flavobacterium sp. IMCC34852]|uniref:FkbM family methyltransferase n=1 Tax=Flavobacterium rivulicola TaxID=2732161 RepID=A0A7Y3R9T1_9FLAO|nr:FkbM family methyltransferase [Flavobacterium sp. IMCC34852]NNT72583.1 FkbM family methyltransferase [Flavobacterium sp. IMCC34852]